ncbi:MAG: hypothetical protein IJ841_00925 [Prevotella sp.]|nr:hypothetical protein [Prevotella sp.]
MRFGLLPEEHRAAACDSLRAKIEQNPSWLYSVDQGATTVWERWDSYTLEGGFHKHHWNMNTYEIKIPHLSTRDRVEVKR